jgi:hypothetical protein
MNGATPIPGWPVRFLAMALEIKRMARLNVIAGSLWAVQTYSSKRK